MKSLYSYLIPRWKEDAVNIKWEPLGYAEGEAAVLAEALKTRLS